MNRRVSVYCLYYIILHYFFLTFHMLPSVVYFSLPQELFFFSVSFFTFLSPFSSPDDEEKRMNYKTDYFHHHTVQSFAFGVETER